MYYAKARYYSPEEGRFLREDPLSGNPENPPSLHRYLYAASNPTFYVDPTGEGNEAAHFYNEYLDARAAGLGNINALIVAVGSQIPDELERYDAANLFFSVFEYSRDYTRDNNSGLHALTGAPVIYTNQAIDNFQRSLANNIYDFAVSEHPAKDATYHIPKASLGDPNAIGFTKIKGHGLSEFTATDNNSIHPQKEIESSVNSMVRIYKYGVKAGLIDADDEGFRYRLSSRLEQIKQKQKRVNDIFNSEKVTKYSIKGDYYYSLNPRSQSSIEFEVLTKYFDVASEGKYTSFRPEEHHAGEDLSDFLQSFDRRTLRLLNGLPEIAGWGEGMSNQLLIEMLENRLDNSARFVRNSINDFVKQKIDEESAGTVMESSEGSGIKVKVDDQK